MNDNQLGSLVRSALKILGAILMAHGATKYAAIINAEDTIGLIVTAVGLLASHNWHRTSSGGASDNSKTGGGANLLLALCAASLFFTGCAGVTAQQAAYRGAATTAVSVDTAMKAWGVYVATYHPGPAVESQVKAAYEKYQAAMVIVCDAGKIYAASGTNSVASVKINQAIADAGQDLIDLENLLTRFGVKLQ